MFKSRRPEILILLVAAFIALVLNHAFWRRFLAVVAPHNAEQWLFFAAALVTMVIIAYLLLLVVSLQPVLKVIVAIAASGDGGGELLHEPIRCRHRRQHGAQRLR